MIRDRINCIPVLLCIGFLYGSCSNSTIDNNNPDLLKKTNSPSSFAVTKVRTVPAKISVFNYFISANGKVRAEQEQLINAINADRLVVCRAKTGDLFSKGELLLQFETAIIKFKLEKARLARFNNGKEYESQLLGYENLLKGKTEEEAADIRQKLKIGSGLATAEQDIKEAEYDLSNASITAPFTGMIADLKVQQGQQVKAGEELLRIYDPGHLLLDVKVLEADATLLRKGMPADVYSVSEPARKIASAVYEINPYVDENGMVLVRLRIAGGRSPGRVLFPGMNCMATVNIPSTRSMVIPKEAIVMRGGRAVVFTMENDKAKWNYVTTGRDNGREIEIINGIRPSAKVIITNNLQLAHDAVVQEETASPAEKKVSE